MADASGGPPGQSTPPYRAGVVALLGLPNAGKSTLLNRLLGQKLAIVTPKPQTTRSALLGILNLERAQLLLLDTPGIREGLRALDVAMSKAGERSVRDCDVAVMLVDLGRGWGEAHGALLARLARRGVPVVAVGTKLDLHPDAPWPPVVEGMVLFLRVSAAKGEGVETLIEAIVERLPPGAPFYLEDELSNRPLRFFAAELVREAAIGELAAEVPYGLAVEVREFDESREDRVRIRADLLVDRQSHKRIVIGAGGARIKRIGIRARREIEALVGRRVHLELWVKVEPGWRRLPKRVRSLGYF